MISLAHVFQRAEKEDNGPVGSFMKQELEYGIGGCLIGWRIQRRFALGGLLLFLVLLSILGSVRAHNFLFGEFMYQITVLPISSQATLLRAYSAHTCALENAASTFSPVL